MHLGTNGSWPGGLGGRGLLRERRSALRDPVEVSKGVEVLVGERFVDVDPEGLGRLRLGV
jgi:hypothetical protein